MKNYDIISFHPGRQHNFEQALQLTNHFKSYKHITSLYFNKEKVRKWNKLAPQIGRILNKRSFEIEKHVIDTYPLPEIKLLLNRKFFYRTKSLEFIRRNELFQKWLIKKYSPPKICIGFDTASWKVFEEWKGLSFLILDLSIAIPQYKLTLAKEYGMNEEFTKNFTKNDFDTYEIYSKEIELADLILCGSEFVKKSCISVGIDENKLEVLPYGTNLEKFSNENIQPNTEIVKVAFIGFVNHRKGVDVLLKAWKKISELHSNAELHFYGRLEMDLPEKLNNVFFHGFLDQDLLISELRGGHISVLPTFFEGSSLAIYQSMALGLAVVTTENSGSIIKDHQNGLVIPYGSVEELIKCLNQLITDKYFRTSLAKNAQRDIQEYTWDEYGRKLSSVLKRHFLR